MQINSFRFNLREFGGALGDLGTLLPLMVALILINGLNATVVLVVVGLLYVSSGLYYRLPTPVQPLKAASAIAITLGLSASTIGAAGLIMGGILLFLAVTNLVTHIVRFFPKAVVRGIQISVGLILINKAVKLIVNDQTLLGVGESSYSINLGNTVIPLGILIALIAIVLFLTFKSSRFPATLAMVTFGLGFGSVFNPSFGLGSLGPALEGISIRFPNGAEFWAALTLLVIPQLPLTFGNAVVGTSDTAKVYFKEKAGRVTPRALSTSMGMSNVVAGLFGAMPICHGSGGLTAHYKLGARTGGANIMIGALFLILGLTMGSAALSVFSLIPFAVLGVLLCIVGVYHALLARDLQGRQEIAVALTIAMITLVAGNLAMGFGAGILLHYTMTLVGLHRLRYSAAKMSIYDSSTMLIQRLPSMKTRPKTNTKTSPAG